MELETDKPISLYRLFFPDDLQAEERVKNMMINAGNKYLGKEFSTIEDITKQGISEYELDILTLAEIEKIVDPELVFDE